MIFRSLPNNVVKAGLICIILIPLFLPLSDQLRFDPVWSLFGRCPHILIFAVLTLFLHRYGPFAGRIGTSSLTGIAVGVVTELVQPAFGRTTSAMDLLFNLAGIGIAAGAVTIRTGRRLAGAVLLMASVAAVVWPMRGFPLSYRLARQAVAEFPLIANTRHESFDDAWQTMFGSSISFPVVPDASGGMRAVMAEFPGGSTWPGIAFGVFPIDWSRYGRLCADMRSAYAAQDTLLMGLRLEDADFLRDGDWYSATYGITGDWRTICFRLHGQKTRNDARPLDPSSIITMKFFARKPAADGSFMVRNIRLEP